MSESTNAEIREWHESKNRNGSGLLILPSELHKADDHRGILLDRLEAAERALDAVFDKSKHLHRELSDTITTKETALFINVMIARFKEIMELTQPKDES